MELLWTKKYFSYQYSVLLQTLFSPGNVLQNYAITVTDTDFVPVQLKSSNSTSIEQSCVDKAINEAKTALQNVDKVQFSLNELNSSIAEHNSNIHGLVNQLESLNNTVKELENLSSYMKWILKVENLR